MSSAKTQLFKMEQVLTESGTLSFAEPDSPPGHPHVVLDLPTGKSRYTIEFSGCTNPLCKCRRLNVLLRAANGRADSEPGFSVTFDKKKTLIEHHPDDRAVVDAFLRRCSSDDWMALYHIFRKFKADCSEISDASEVETEFPEDVLADPSCLVAYQQVF